MTNCPACGGAIDPGGSPPSLRAGEHRYHPSCAPPEVVAAALEEYEAILRKGIRYFVEKYGDTPPSPAELGTRFLNLGRALEAERERRTARAGPR
jgi:hypothetical protein